MFATTWTCTQEWSLIRIRRTALTFATCHQARSETSALARAITSRRVRLPRAGRLIRIAATASRAHRGAALGLDARRPRCPVARRLDRSLVVRHARVPYTHGARAAPRTWPARYRLHKYWSRKPPDLVAGGSPPRRRRATSCSTRSAAPASRRSRRPRSAAGRSAIDVNPFAILLARATAAPCDPDALAAAGARGARGGARRGGRPGTSRAAGAAAARRRSPATARARHGDRGRARALPALRRHASRAADGGRPCARRARARPAGDGGAPRPPVVPRLADPEAACAPGSPTSASCSRPATCARSRRCARAILAEPDGAERDLLLLALTGALAQASRMMADHGRAGGGASWKLNIYWLPERSLELDPFRCFANRLARVVAAKRETAALLDGRASRRGSSCADARGLGELVAGRPVALRRSPTRRTAARASSTRELSALWCAWLEPALAPRSPTEIGENPHRGRDRGGVRGRPRWTAFAAVRRALAPDGRDDRHVRVQRPALVAGARRGAARRAGFARRSSEEFAPRSAPGLTERTSPRRDAHRRLAGVRARRGAADVIRPPREPPHRSGLAEHLDQRRDLVVAVALGDGLRRQVAHEPHQARR